MSISNKYQILALDPIVFNDGRAEWELPLGVYDSDSAVLANLGMFSSEIAVANTTATYYPLTCGVGVCIDRFTLLSGSDEIEFLDNVAQWVTHRALNVPYGVNEDIYHNTLHNGWAWAQQRDQNVGVYDLGDVAVGGITLNSKRVDYLTKSNASDDDAIPNNQSRIGNRQYAPGSSGSIPLKMISGLFSSAELIQNVPRLRIVIEYNTTLEDYYSIDGNGVTSLRPTFPILLIRKLLAPPPQPPVLNVPFFTVRCDNGFIVPATEAGAQQNMTYQSYAFTNKMIKDITMFTKTGGNRGVMLHNVKSVGIQNETINFIIDGNRYIPDVGITNAALKMSYLINTHGNYTLPMLCQVSGLQEDAGQLVTDNQDVIGSMSLFAVKVDYAPKSQIQMEYSRKPMNVVEGGEELAQLNILLYARLSEILTITSERASIGISS